VGQDKSGDDKQVLIATEDLTQVIAVMDSTRNGVGGAAYYADYICKLHNDELAREQAEQAAK